MTSFEFKRSVVHKFILGLQEKHSKEAGIKEKVSNI